MAQSHILTSGDFSERLWKSELLFQIHNLKIDFSFRKQVFEHHPTQMLYKSEREIEIEFDKCATDINPFPHIDAF